MAKQDTKQYDGGTIKIQYYKSVIGYSKKQKAIVKSLGITKLNQTVSRPDNPSMRGIVAKKNAYHIFHAFAFGDIIIDITFFL